MIQINQPLHVLVADDNPADRALVIRELRREFPQLQVQEIVEAEALAQALTERRFDVVVTDYQLHWTTGLDILQAVKQRYPHCPVVMFTNTGNEEVAVEAMKAGLDDYVLKSQNRYARLSKAVRGVLEQAETRRRAALLEVRLQGLLSQLSVGVFRSDVQGNLLECNLAFFHILGVNSLAEAQALQPLNLRELFQRAIALPPGQKNTWEIQIQQANGTPIWVLLNVTLNTVEGESVIDGLVENITARKQAEAELQKLNETLEERVSDRTAQLQEAIQDLEEFSYSVSHDLREPLRAIQGFSHILIEEKNLPTSNSETYLQRIHNAAQHANQLVQDLLTYSRLSRAEIPLQPINLSRIVQDTLIQLESELQQKKVQIQVEKPLPDVVGNRTVLGQIITNLLTNAIKFVEPGVKPQIRLWAEERVISKPLQSHSDSDPAISSKKIRLWLEDNGIGISHDYQEQIFGMFTRLHGNEIYSGTGIGLAIVRRGVQRMNGSAGVVSELGKGSRFWIELPAVIEN